MFDALSNAANPANATRRQWLRLCIGLGAGLAASASGAKPAALVWRERAMVGLGTTLSLRAAHADGAQADAGLDAAVAQIRHVERLMSLFDPQSALSQLNRDGVLRYPHPDFARVLQLAQRVSRQSAGAFDATVQPLWLAWQSAQQAGRLPTQAEIGAARARVGWQNVEVTPRQIRLKQTGMALTLNGIAQGFAGDLAKAALRSHGIRHALLDTGEWSALGNSTGQSTGPSPGQNTSLGPNPSAWRLGIEDPRKAGSLVAKLALDGRAVATSSDAHYRFGQDDVHHHIFNPATGYSPHALASVTVLAPSCALADALTKVMFMGSAQRAMQLAQRWQVDVLAVEKTGQWRASPGLAALLRA